METVDEANTRIKLCIQIWSYKLKMLSPKFKRVVSLLSNCSGHATIRKARSFRSSLPQNPNLFLETPHCRPKSPPNSNSSQLLPTNLTEIPVSKIESKWRSNSLLNKPVSTCHNPILQLDSSPKTALQLAQSKPSLHYQLLQQQQQQQMKYQAEMMFSSSSNGMNRKSDGSSCTQTASSGRSSFISSLSLDGSMATLDNNSFHLPQFSDQHSYQHRERCGRPGTVKCRSTDGWSFASRKVSQ